MKITSKNFEKFLKENDIEYTKENNNLTVGGYLYLRGTNIKNKNIELKRPSKNFINDFKKEVEKSLCWQNGKYRIIDGIFCEILSSKGNILKIKSYNKIAIQR